MQMYLPYLLTTLTDAEGSVILKLENLIHYKIKITMKISMNNLPREGYKRQYISGKNMMKLSELSQFTILLLGAI